MNHDNFNLAIRCTISMTWSKPLKICLYGVILQNVVGMLQSFLINEIMAYNNYVVSCLGR
jgi:hypothetical protein